MIKVDPTKIPAVRLLKHGVDDWDVIVEEQYLARGLPEYVARMFAAAPIMLEFLSRMTKRPSSPACLPIQAMLKSVGIEIHHHDEVDHR